MKLILLRIVSTIAALILSTTLIAAATGWPSSDFVRFKRKNMPKVGHKITVVGVLASAKLGWMITLKSGGIYVYAVQDSDISKMKALDSFNGWTVKVTGTLRYSPGSASQRTDVANVPEHFFFDVAEVKVIRRNPPRQEQSKGRYLRRASSLSATARHALCCC
jgi:hypothetical protein